jgi:hypothetical protein
MASNLSPRFDPAPYWGVVEDCLVDIHGLSCPEARKRIADLQVWMASLPHDDGNIVYHDEQFRVACELAGRELSQDDYQQNYDEIIDRHYPGWLQVRESYLAQTQVMR